MKSFVLLIVCILVFCIPEKSQAQDEWQIGMDGAIVRFPDGNTEFEKDQYLFQAPRLNVTKRINERFSINGAISFNAIEITEITRDRNNYFSLDSFLRYSLIKDSNFLDPYVFVGGSLVGININFVLASNFGFGNTFWFLKNLGLNIQGMYKLSFEVNTSHFQFTTGLVYNLDSGRKNLWDVKR